MSIVTISEDAGSPTIANSIKRRREALGWTQEDLAKRTGIAQNKISNFENGVHMPRRADLLKLCEVFHCNIGDLYFIQSQTTAA